VGFEISRPLARDGDGFCSRDLTGEFQASHDFSDELFVGLELLNRVRQSEDQAAAVTVPAGNNAGNERFARNVSGLHFSEAGKTVSFHVLDGAWIYREEGVDFKRPADREEDKDGPSQHHGQESKKLPFEVSLVDGDHPPLKTLAIWLAGKGRAKGMNK
jgi:hypothetical protein